MKRICSLLLCFCSIICFVPANEIFAESQLPNLIPTVIIYDSNNISINHEVLFDSGINNVGNADTDGFNIKWFVNDVEVGYGGHCGVAAYSTELDDNSAYCWTPSSAGTYVIKFVIDADNQIYESNENDNEIYLTIYVPSLDTQSSVLIPKKIQSISYTSSICGDITYKYERDVRGFTVNTSGNYEIVNIGELSTFIFLNDINMTNITNNDMPFQYPVLKSYLVAGNTYYIEVCAMFENDTGPYEVQINGPACVTLISPPVVNTSRVEILLDALYYKYDGKYWTTTGTAENRLIFNMYYYNGIQCKAFANWVADILYNLNGKSIGSTYTGKDAYYGGKINISDKKKVYQVGDTLVLKDDNDISKLKKLFSDAPNGSFIQAMGNNKIEHSMIYYKSKNENSIEYASDESINQGKIWVFDCNFDGKCKVSAHAFTYSEFIKKYKAVSIYTFADDPKYIINEDFMFNFDNRVPKNGFLSKNCSIYDNIECKNVIKKLKYGTYCLVTALCGDVAKVTYPTTVTWSYGHSCTVINSVWVKTCDISSYYPFGKIRD